MAATKSKFEQDLSEVEDKLIRTLSKTYANIKRDMNIELSTIGGSRITWLEVQQIYRKQVDDAIRSAVTATYEISAKKTVERDLKVSFFLTDTDMAEIKLLTKKYQDMTWRLWEKQVAKEQQEELLSQFKSASIKEDIGGVIGMIAMSINGEAAARAVISKVKQVVSAIARPFRRRQIQTTTSTPEPRTTTTTTSPITNILSDPSGEPIPQSEPRRITHLRWVTAHDNRVCEICEPLDGEMYELDDPNTPVPSDDLENTHPRCRCRLLPIDAEVE